MKIKLIHLIASFLALILFFSISASAVDLKPKSMLVLGDSISTGYGLDGYPNANAASYCNRLASSFGLSGDNYTNKAIDGNNSANLLSQLTDEEIAKKIKSSDTIIISIGGNDILDIVFSSLESVMDSLPEQTGQDTAETLSIYSDAIKKVTAEIEKPDVQYEFQAGVNGFLNNYKKIIEKIKIISPTAKIYVQTVYNPFDGVYGFGEISSYCENYLSQMNQEIASTSGIAVINIHSAFKGKAMAYTNIMSMDIHPNIKGHHVIYREIYNTIMPKPIPKDFKGRTLLASAEYILNNI